LPDQTTIDLAKTIARRWDLNPAVFCGLVQRESNWNPWAIRFENLFFQKYIAPQVMQRKITDNTEAYARAFSWGPCQVMGEEARERGYTGDLAKLCDWDTGLEIGAKTLAFKIGLAGGNVEAGLERYNGGDNPDYSTEVLTFSEKYAA
jgi:soluble lytic murein transglycosylase-like protein